MEFSNHHDIINAYENGLQGAFIDEKHTEELIQSLPKGKFCDAAPHLAGDGKGKLSLPYKSVLKFDPNAYEERQTTGDCHDGYTKVLMADLSIKDLQDVKIGEYVISGKGKVCRVIDFIKKDYSGTIVCVWVEGSDIANYSTPDHKYYFKSDDTYTWSEIGSVKVGDYVHSLVNGEWKDSKVVKVHYTEVKDCKVYCIGVEEDHSFIANNLVSANCVSHGSRNAIDISRAVQLDINNELGSWEGRGATEAIYGSRGYGSQGMAGSVAAKFAHSKGGIAIRRNYEGIVDLSKYNSSIGTRWGAQGGVPNELCELLKKNQVKAIALAQSLEECRDALANGYGIAVCSNYGFSSTRDSKGFARRQGSWSHCYTSDTLVWTPYISKYINEIKVGDKIVGHDGNIHKVTNTFEREYSGNLIKFKTYGLPEISCTPEHPLLVYRGTIVEKQCKRYDKESNTLLKTKEKYKVKFHSDKAEWIEAKDLKIDDYVVVPSINYFDDHYNTPSLPKWVGVNNRCKNIPNEIKEVNDDLAWYFGLYIGDGNIIKNHKVVITLAKKEVESIKKAQYVIEKVLGLKSYLIEKETYTRVVAYSKVLAASFLEWFGRYSRQRYIPEFLFKGWDLNAVVNGVLSSDGFEYKNHFGITSTSIKLIYQLFHILTSLGEYVCINKCHIGKGAYPNGRPRWTVRWIKEPTKNNHRLKFNNNHLLLPIREIKKEYYNGMVYNFEVEGVNSYIADGIATHNCMAWTGCDNYTNTNEIVIIIQQSWGLWNSGGQPDYGIPPGAFLIHEDDARGMVRAGGAWIFSNCELFPARKLPDYGSSSYL